MTEMEKEFEREFEDFAKEKSGFAGAYLAIGGWLGAAIIREKILMLEDMQQSLDFPESDYVRIFAGTKTRQMLASKWIQERIDRLRAELKDKE